MKLKPKHELFCREYIIDCNAAQAAIRAGYAKKSAKVTASRLLTNDNLLNFIKELQIPKVENLGITAEYVLGGIKYLADGAEKESDKLKAFDMLGKYIGIYEKDNSQTETNIEVNITPMEISKAIADGLPD